MAARTGVTALAEIDQARRLAFGGAAERYDRHRPSYPSELIDDLVALAGLDGSRPVLEVGAGTGKATVLFASRGVPVVAVEPSGEMAEVGRRNCQRVGSVAVQFEQADFERWDAAGRSFPLLYSGQAWHWVEPAPGYAKAVEVLEPGGVFAAFWNRIAWEESPLREALREAYLQAAPQLPEGNPMHPATAESPEREPGWYEEIAQVDGLSSPEVRSYAWNETLSRRQYVDRLATSSEILLLAERDRGRLLEATGAVIDEAGGSITLPARTRLCLARRARANENSSSGCGPR